METKKIQLNPENIDMGVIKEAAAIVDSGGFVVFPTETVYGIAARVKNDTLSKLNLIKNRADNKHYTLHIAKNTDVFKYVPKINLRARKLIQNAWPGPLTLIFDLNQNDIRMQRTKLEMEAFDAIYKDGTIGIRCPDNPIASLLLQEATNPVVAPSANISDRPPAVTAEQALEQLSGKIDIVLDGGQCKFKKSSTVAKINKTGIEILREGAFSQTELDFVSQIKFLFVCTGNTCRSPMAEGIFKKYLAQKLNCDVDELENMGYKVSSAGIIGSSGYRASFEAIEACAKQGVNIENHRNQGLTSELITESDFIFAMERIHLTRILALEPQAENRCLLLAGDKEILDPIGQPQRIYDSCVKIITKAVKERISELIL
ncbi:MAG: threonylcarbamoyl-AMP synthase [Sedimentisphaerales bacterium]|nr:threonylcarbamoyl-AMP synthase [Sedimentisphaerales bacterium]